MAFPFAITATGRVVYEQFARFCRVDRASLRPGRAAAAVAGTLAPPRPTPRTKGSLPDVRPPPRWGQNES